MNKYRDLASLSPEDIDDSAPSSTPTLSRSQERPIPRSERQFLKFEGGEVVHVNAYVRNLGFRDRARLLFGGGLEEPQEALGGSVAPTGNEEGEEPPAWTKPLLKVLLALLVVLSVLYLISYGMRGVQKALSPETPPPVGFEDGLAEGEEFLDMVPSDEWKGVSLTVQAEIDLYNREESRKIQDYLDIRANRGSTITSIRMQRTKKENTYLYLAQNRGFFRDEMETYETLQERVVRSIALSEEALRAFELHSTTGALRALLPKYRQ